MTGEWLETMSQVWEQEKVVTSYSATCEKKLYTHVH